MKLNIWSFLYKTVWKLPLLAHQTQVCMKRATVCCEVYSHRLKLLHCSENLSPDVVSSLIVVSDVLCVTVIQGQDGWGVTYSSTEICALKGSTVEINCTYRYPSWKNYLKTEVKERFWFTKLSGNQLDSDYQDRVEYSCSEKSCSLRIRDLRESDSAKYKFMFITNQEGGTYTGSPGVTLRITGNIFIHILIVSKCSTS